MIVIAITEHEGKQSVVVHRVNKDGSTEDVTQHYRASQLMLQNQDGEYIAGWHIGMVCEPPEEEEPAKVEKLTAQEFAAELARKLPNARGGDDGQ
jgi:hypothetical protein